VAPPHRRQSSLEGNAANDTDSGRYRRERQARTSRRRALIEDDWAVVNFDRVPLLTPGPTSSPPISLTRAKWWRHHFGAAFLRLPSRDLAKFGYLYLNGGQWDGHQLIPADYVAAATSPRGRSPNLSMGYGWHWWVAIEEGHQTFSARGYGSQFVRRPRPGPRDRHHQQPPRQVVSTPRS
jgi:CubicO group peptidase (beta-lactamase class C family)